MEAKILVSACLLGQPVRYNGRALSLESELLERWKAQDRVVPLCPEVAAGLATPRPPAEIEPSGSGAAVADGTARIFDVDGGDVTEAFLSGARIALDTARAHGCGYALLTDGSPSCGSGFIYSGHHDGIRRKGQGVTATVLSQAGIRVFAQHQIRELGEALAATCLASSESGPRSR